MKKTTTVLMSAGALVLGAAVGSGATYATMQPTISEFASENRELGDALADVEAERDLALDDKSQAVSEYTTELTKLGSREDELDERERELKEREETVEAVESRIEANSFHGGVIVVGRDVSAGEYRTTGISDCYYAWKTGTDSNADIVDNNIVSGSATVTLNDGDVFESNRCGTWKKIE